MVTLLEKASLAVSKSQRHGFLLVMLVYKPYAHLREFDLGFD